MNMPNSMADASVVDVTDAHVELTRPLDAFHVAPAPAQTFRGWGISLAWEGNVLYGSPFMSPFSSDPAFAGKVIDLLYGDPSSRLTLGLNIGRYNIGGGDGTHRHMSQNAQMETFQDGPGAAFNFTRDAGQRRLLREAKARGANLFEAFANSPPNWMTNSGCASGGTTGGENLNPAYDDAFVNYLVTSVQHLQQSEGVTFESLEPFNEPDGKWWKANGSQEGYFASPATQNRVLPKVAHALSTAGLSTFVSAADDNNRDHMTSTLGSYTGIAVGSIHRVNTHSYSGTNRWALRAEAGDLHKPLWMSEVGCCLGARNIYGQANDNSRIWQALWTADTIRLDVRDMRSEAWVLWQADWNVIAFNDGHTPIPLKMFYATAHYSNFIRPGFQVISVDADNTFAAYSADAHRLVLVATNWDTATPVQYDFSSYAGHPTLSVFRTTADAATNLASVAGLAVDSNGQLADTLPVRSITTYVIDGITPIAEEPGFKGALHPRGHPDVCLSVANDTHGPASAAIVLDTCHTGSDAQTFTYDPATGHITAFAGAAQVCLNVWGGVANNGATLGTWPCQEAANERFSYDQVHGQLRMWTPTSGTNGSCFDVLHHQFTPGAGVFMYECSTSADGYQQFDRVGP
jgi:O-glycosyl hydrolase